MTARHEAQFEVKIHRRGGAWLAGFAASGLLSLAVFTCVVRADLVGEGYALARCEAQLRSVERTVRAVDADILERFATFELVAEPDTPDDQEDTEY